MSKEIRGTYFRKDIEGLGEFRFVFSENQEITKGTDKYFMEAFWNPSSYGLVDFVVGYYISDIDEEIEKLKSNMDYFIDDAKISCIGRIEENQDNEGVYEGILRDYFEYKDEDVEVLYKEQEGE